MKRYELWVLADRFQRWAPGTNASDEYVPHSDALAAIEAARREGHEQGRKDERAETIHPPWYASILNERDRQDAKWGANRDLNPFVWAAILSEECGEVARCCLQSTTDEPLSLLDLPKELIQVAAVATQFLESIDRRLAAAPTGDET